jgi:hypothetical protein
MKTKIVITERQYSKLTKFLNENAHSAMVKRMKEDLDINYNAVDKFVREGGEYFEKPMIEIKADGEIISPKSLYEYMKYKYNMGDDFTKQVIKDWVFGKITDDYRLSKNVSMN